MNLRRSVLVGVVLGSLVAGTCSVMPARAVDARCLDPNRVMLRRDYTPALRDPAVVPAAWDVGSRGWNGGDWPVVVSRLSASAYGSLFVPEDVCPGTTLVLRGPDGAVRELRLPHFIEAGSDSAYIGELPVWPADSGSWLLTGIRSGTGSATVEPPKRFWVLQKVVVSLDHLPVVAAGVVVPVTGRVVVYTRDGVPAPVAGRRIELMTTNFDGDDQQSIGTAVTDARGRFSMPLRVARARLVRATVNSIAPYAGDTDATVSYAGSGIQLLSAWQIPVLGGINTVIGRTTPGYRTVLLESQDGGAVSEYWTNLGSATSGADGRFTIRFRAGNDTPQTIRIRTAGTAFQDRYEATAAHRTMLTGFTGGTHTTVIRPGTKMSTFGRLKVTFNNGAVGNYANQPIAVQTKTRGNPSAIFTTVASTRTTSTGYYYVNWTARHDVDVRVTYPSPYRTVQWAVTPHRFVDVH